MAPIRLERCAAKRWTLELKATAPTDRGERAEKPSLTTGD